MTIGQHSLTTVQLNPGPAQDFSEAAVGPSDDNEESYEVLSGTIIHRGIVLPVRTMITYSAAKSFDLERNWRNYSLLRRCSRLPRLTENGAVWC
jgi:hypothetical protein